jgi:lipopolysaccharide export system protein LptA
MTTFRVLRVVLGLLVGSAIAAGAAHAQATGDLFKGFGGKSKDPIQVDAKELEIYEDGDDRVSVFSGGVTIKRGTTTMKAGTVKLYSDKKGDDNTSFKKMEATGTVYVNSGQQTATGARALVDMKANTITLSGNVVLSQGKTVMTGDKLIVDMTNGRAKLEQNSGQIRGVFTPDAAKKNKGGSDDKADPPTN